MSKQIRYLLMVGFLLPIVMCFAHNNNDGPSQVEIKTLLVQGLPKTSSFEVTLDGHWLSVVFLENLGRVTVEVLDSGGNDTLTESTPTPNGLNIYIPYAGSYVIYFTLSNGDVYYGEFEVTD